MYNATSGMSCSSLTYTDSLSLFRLVPKTYRWLRWRHHHQMGLDLLPPIESKPHVAFVIRPIIAVALHLKTKPILL